MMLLDITGFGLGNAIPIDTIKPNPLLSSKEPILEIAVASAP